MDGQKVEARGIAAETCNALRLRTLRQSLRFSVEVIPPLVPPALIDRSDARKLESRTRDNRPDPRSQKRVAKGFHAPPDSQVSADSFQRWSTTIVERWEARTGGLSVVYAVIPTKGEKPDPVPVIADYPANWRPTENPGQCRFELRRRAGDLSHACAENQFDTIARSARPKRSRSILTYSADQFGECGPQR